MTSAELRDYVFQELDEYTTPNITDLRMSVFLNKSYDVFFDENYPKYQNDEWARQALFPLQRKVAPAASLTINQDAVLDFRYMTALAGWFKNDCSGNFERRPIRPLDDDVKYTVLNDSFAKPTNTYPRYELTNNGTVKSLFIHADSAPNQLELMYLKRPDKIDIVAAPTAVLELTDFYMKKVGDFAVKRIMKTFEDPRFNVEEAVMADERP